MTRKLQIGDVFIVDLGLAGKVRPVVILSRQDEQAPRALALAVPLSLENRSSRYEVLMPRVPWLRNQGVANVQGIFPIKLQELRDYRGRFDRKTVFEIRRALLWALDLEQLSSHLAM